MCIRDRIKGYLLLSEAFRSLSRLSSALSAKASSLRSLQLNLQNSLAILVWSVLHSVALQTWLLLNCFVFPLMLLNGLGCLLFLMIGMLLPFIFLSRCLRSFDLSQAWYWYLRLFSMFSFQGTPLSYSLIEILLAKNFNQPISLWKVVGQSGLEPPTSRLSVVCSSQLSYWPIFAHFFLVEISGIEPLTSCLQGRRSPSWAKPPYLHHSYLGTLFAVPSKLNNAKRFDTLYWP